MKNSRAIAATIINDVCYAKKSLTDVFNKRLSNNSDAAFIKSLCFGSLRFYFQLQDVLGQLLNKPLKTKDKDIECLIIVGLYQLLHTDTPPYAAINETVNGAKQLKKTWAQSLINKILRLANQKVSYNLESVESQYAHPLWLVNKIKAAWPEHWKSILAANNKQPPLYLRINKTLITKDDYVALLSKENIQYQIIENLPFALEIKDPISVEKLPGFSAGFFSVQDITGQKVIEYLDLEKDQSVLDACCAPGSKTTHILESQPNIMALFGIDISDKRLEKVKANIHRLNLSVKNVNIKASDITELHNWWDEKCFDRILIDAPCSASGVIRRHPDIKILREESDIASLAKIQLEIL